MIEGMKVYVDTSCLRSNVRHADAKSLNELAALEQLTERCSLFGSRLNFREVMATAEATRRDGLIFDWRALRPIPKDERVLGFSSQSDQYGGFISYPLVADCQDETLRSELIDRETRTKGTPSMDYSFWEAYTRTQWNPVPQLDIGLQVMYTHNNTAYKGPAALAANGSRPAVVNGIIDDQNVWSAMFRWQRNFYP